MEIKVPKPLQKKLDYIGLDPKYLVEDRKRGKTYKELAGQINLVIDDQLKEDWKKKNKSKPSESVTFKRKLKKYSVTERELRYLMGLNGITVEQKRDFGVGSILNNLTKRERAYFYKREERIKYLDEKIKKLHIKKFNMLE